MTGTLILAEGRPYYLVPRHGTPNAYDLVPPVGPAAGTIYLHADAPADVWWSARADAPREQGYRFAESAAAKALEGRG